VSPGGVGGELPDALYRGKTLTIAGTTLSAPVVDVPAASAGQFASKSIAGNMGAGILGRFTVTFDYAHRTVSFVPNAHAGEPFIGDRTGLSLTQPEAGFFLVLSVAPNSPAAEAGLKAGDRIVEIAGQNVASGNLGGGDIHAFFIDMKRTELPLVYVRGDAKQAVSLKLRQLV
jgi:S1-C subfamily serine protease